MFEDAMYIFAGDRERGDWADSLGYLAYVAANLNTCQFRKPFKDLIEFCKHTYPTTVEDGTVSLAVDKNMSTLNKEHQSKNTWEPDMSTEFNNNFHKCTWKGLLDNTSKNAFILMGSLSNFTATAMNFPGTDSDEIFS